MRKLVLTFPAKPLPALCAVAALAVGCAANVGDRPEGSRATNQALSTASPALHVASLPSDPHWTAGLSQDSVVFGADADGAPLYACRARYGSSIQVGKTRASWGFCDFAASGGETNSADYQTLIAQWMPASNGAIPTGAFTLGWEAGDTAEIAACRGTFAGSVQVGKIERGWPGCDVPYGGGEHTITDYQVLGDYGAGPAYPITALSVSANSPPPSSAVFGGGTDTNGGALFPCMVDYGGGDGVQVGKVRADWTACDIGWGGREFGVVNTPYTMVGPRLQRTSPNPYYPPVSVGSDTNGAALGICVASYLGSMQVGKTDTEMTACLFGYGGRQVQVRSFSYF